MSEDFKVKVGEFEGPLGVLLNLIEEKKMPINQVALGQVADDFLAFLPRLDQENKHAIADFILVASTLMLIKSISLLPELPTTPEEQASMAELEQRLALYQTTRRLSEWVKNSFGQQVIFTRQPSKNITPIFTPTTELTLTNLTQVLKNLIQSFPKLIKLPEVTVKKILSLEEVIGDLTRRVQSALKMSFKSFVGGAERVNVIVSFLGMLELVKQGMMSAEQTSPFDDIQLESTQTGVPKYL